jgi:serine/threonine-protein kinase
MGTVWLARDQKLGRSVALKLMAGELAQMSEALLRFEREAKAVAKLHSTHVVQVFDYGLQEGLPFIVMELLEGENLSQRLRRQGQLSLDEVAKMLDQMCKGLKAAHAAGLVHRDLKPSNVFIARRDDDEVVKLLDFGVVKALNPNMNEGSSEATSTGILLGTPQYMSPEQARAIKEIDHRSDLWSAAVIVFRLLTGKNPFRGESVGDVVLKICSDELPRIADYVTCPANLDLFFEKAFARNPRDRFQSAAELARMFHLSCTTSPPISTKHTVVMRDAVPVGHSLEAPPVSAPPVSAPTPPMPIDGADPAKARTAGGLPKPLSAQALAALTTTVPDSSYPAAADAAATPGMFDAVLPSSQGALDRQSSVPTSEPSDSEPVISVGSEPRPPFISVVPPQHYNAALDATPISTTVGGTQLAPKLQLASLLTAPRPLAVVVIVAAMAVVAVLVIGLSLGGESEALTIRPVVHEVVPPTSFVERLEEELGDEAPRDAKTVAAKEDEPPPTSAVVASSTPAVSARPSAAPASTPRPRDRPDWGLPK